MEPAEAVDHLLRSFAGQIVGCNMVAGVENGLVDRKLVCATFDWLARLVTYDPSLEESEKFVGSLRRLRQSEYPRGMDPLLPRPQFRLQDRAPLEEDDLRGNVSSILPAPYLHELLSEADQSNYLQEGLLFPFDMEELDAVASIERWQTTPRSKRRPRLDSKKTVGRPRSVLWFTRRRSLAAALMRRDEENRAQRGRDVLGLVHHAKDRVLAAVHFPAGILARHSARPTFADAADHRRFRAWPDGSIPQANRRWGHTVDLRALHGELEDADGCPERVTPEIPGDALPNGGRVEFEILGPVESARGASDPEDKEFVDRLLSGLGGLSPDALRRRLLSYL